MKICALMTTELLSALPTG
jgi:hypothetical protein